MHTQRQKKALSTKLYDNSSLTHPNGSPQKLIELIMNGNAFCICIAENYVENIEFNMKFMMSNSPSAKLLQTLNKIKEDSECLKKKLDLIILVIPSMKENCPPGGEEIACEKLPKRYVEILKNNGIPEKICMQATILVMIIIKRLLHRIDRQLVNLRKGKGNTDENQLRISESQLSILIKTFLTEAIKADPNDIFYKSPNDPVWVELSKHYSTYVFLQWTLRTARETLCTSATRPSRKSSRHWPLPASTPWPKRDTCLSSPTLSSIWPITTSSPSRQRC
eukprot:TRINITY_DN8775_c0_g1_i3.p1 TRINITY_DN8775_c0_g1~~TRINITY_DN8775_c0_g1_i3.p1  ORF type:complete len:279 (+),score=10.32 TRINITY_DN8775_c0_g1_i3:241-1077(+)